MKSFQTASARNFNPLTIIDYHCQSLTFRYPYNQCLIRIIIPHKDQHLPLILSIQSTTKIASEEGLVQQARCVSSVDILQPSAHPVDGDPQGSDVPIIGKASQPLYKFYPQPWDFLDGSQSMTDIMVHQPSQIFSSQTPTTQISPFWASQHYGVPLYHHSYYTNMHWPNEPPAQALPAGTMGVPFQEFPPSNQQINYDYPQYNTQYPTQIPYDHLQYMVRQASSSHSNPHQRTRPRRRRCQNEKKHICPICNKSFLRPSALKQHNKTHTGERPYCCEFPTCGRSRPGNGFSILSNLRRHVKALHTDKEQRGGGYGAGS